MKKNTIIIEDTFNAPVEKVWEAITNRKELNEWFFEIDEFELKKGFVFTFYTGDEELKYEQKCTIVEIIPLQKLVFTWGYPDVEGSSTVTYELHQKENKTHIKLTHEGTDSFPQNRPCLRTRDLKNQWEQLIPIALKRYVENN